MTEVFVESCGQRYRAMVLQDFVVFRDKCLSTTGWSPHLKDNVVEVQSKPPDNPSGLNIIRVKRLMKDVPPQQLYDFLHDADYRKTWYANMLCGYNVVQLNPHNDIGYYAAKFPWPLANRDFCNMRSWMEFSDGEFIIFNHSEPHRDCDTKKGFVRANSIMSGYYIKLHPSMGSSGCWLHYLTHTDVKGSIPHSIINFTMTKSVPSIMNRMEQFATEYAGWAAKTYPPGTIHGWRTEKMEWGSAENYPVSKVADFSTAPMNRIQAPASEAKKESGGAGSTYDDAASREKIRHLEAQVDELTRKLFLAMHQSQTDAANALSLAPVAPAREGDPVVVQRYRALLNDAVIVVDRQFIQEGYIPTTREYLTKLHFVLLAMKSST